MLPAMNDDPFAQFKATFFEECAELLADMEQQLAALEAGEYTNETLHAIFRAVHSIKAGAGAFSYTQLVEFSHKLEFLLDELREERLAVSERLVETLFTAFDILSDLVSYAQNGEVPDEGYSREALAQIEEFLAGGGPSTEDADAEDDDSFGMFEPLTPEEEEASSDPSLRETSDDGLTHYRIEFTPRVAMYRHANEPLLIIRELRELGRLETKIDTSRLPSLQAMEPEDAYFSWVFELWTHRNREDVDEVFEFVVDDCDLTIVTLDNSEQVVDVDVKPSQASRDASTPGFGFFVDEEDIKQGAVSAAAPAADQQQKKEEPKTTAAQAAPPTQVPAKATETPAPTAAAKPAGTPVKVASIRVDVDRVDRLVNMVGELVITQSMLAQEVQNDEGRSSDKVTNGMDELSMHIRELQENVMSIRMQPVKSVFSRMPRIVRDVSKKLEKKVKLVTVGEDTEVDKTVIEELADPLTHMIRNSLDHGLEKPADRIAVGKPEEGVIRLSAEHRGGRIVIEITDDGRGINRKRVHSLAVEKGVIAADAQLSDSEIDNLIFAPGFSTAEEVTDLSGRGVGMDVVRRNIQSLGGRVSVSSEPGKGAKFQLTLPLTLAVLDGMIVGIGDQKYVIPINSILETVRPPKKDVERLVDGGQVVRVRGEYIRIVPVAQIFGLEGSAKTPSEGLVILTETEGGRTVGLLVDYLAGQQQVVIKSLETNYRAVEGVASATILGDGSVCLILDIDGISKMPVPGQEHPETPAPVAAE